jgi:hypothetical protein
MPDRKAALADLVRAVMGGRVADFEEAGKAAYGAGARPEELLWAVEMGASLGEVPAAVWAQGYATVHLWSWMAARRR